MNTTVQHVAVALGAVLALAGLGAAAQVPQRYLALPSNDRAAATIDWDAKAQTSLFGEFRTTLADYLLLKADRTHHRGVMIRAKTDRERAQDGAERIASSAAHDGREHNNETTVVPTRQHDWRGWIGKAQREVEPMMDLRNHKHGSIRQTTALYWLTAKSNPYMERAFVEGSFVMRAGAKDAAMAVAFLREGERHNPNAAGIQTELGHCLFLYQGEHAEAERHLSRAIQLVNAVPNPDDEAAEARMNAYRWLALLYEKEGRTREAERLARSGLRVLGEDTVLSHVLARVGGQADASLPAWNTPSLDPR